MPMEKLDQIIKEMREKWLTMSGSDQFAVAKATFYLEADGYHIDTISDDDLKHYAYKGCQAINEGNAEPEYEDEDFFEEEANEEKVFEYLQIKREYEKIRKSC